MKKQLNPIIPPFLILLILLSITNNISKADGSAGEKYSFDSRFCIDMPTAGILPKYNYAVNTTIMNKGAVQIECDIALLEDLLLGVSYSVNGILGSGDLITTQKYPGISFKYRFLDERRSIPAIAIGFNSQGKGLYHKNFKRFDVLSPGLFLAMSKNFKWSLGELSTHLSFNYSIEPNPEERNPNLALGFEQMLGSRLAYCMEYNANTDENEIIYKKKGLINASLKYAIGFGLTLEFQAKDLFQNHSEYKAINRFFKIEYINSF